MKMGERDVAPDVYVVKGVRDRDTIDSSFDPVVEGVGPCLVIEVATHSRRGAMEYARLRVMARLNLTLDNDTFSRLDQYAQDEGRARSAIARELQERALRLYMVGLRMPRSDKTAERVANASMDMTYDRQRIVSAQGR